MCAKSKDEPTASSIPDGQTLKATIDLFYVTAQGMDSRFQIKGTNVAFVLADQVSQRLRFFNRRRSVAPLVKFSMRTTLENQCGKTIAQAVVPLSGKPNQLNVGFCLCPNDGYSNDGNSTGRIPAV